MTPWSVRLEGGYMVSYVLYVYNLEYIWNHFIESPVNKSTQPFIWHFWWSPAQKQGSELYWPLVVPSYLVIL